MHQLKKSRTLLFAAAFLKGTLMHIMSYKDSVGFSFSHIRSEGICWNIYGFQDREHILNTGMQEMLYLCW